MEPGYFSLAILEINKISGFDLSFFSDWFLCISLSDNVIPIKQFLDGSFLILAEYGEDLILKVLRR